MENYPKELSFVKTINYLYLKIKTIKLSLCVCSNGINLIL